MYDEVQRLPWEEQLDQSHKQGGCVYVPQQNMSPHICQNPDLTLYEQSEKHCEQGTMRPECVTRVKASPPTVRGKQIDHSHKGEEMFVCPNRTNQALCLANR